MRDEFIVKRDYEREEKLKNILLDLESRLDNGEDERTLSDKFAEANMLVSTEGRIIDANLITYYYEWTSMEGLVGELTMSVPRITDFDKSELVEFITWLRKVIHDEISLEDIDFEYFTNFYHLFFEINFPYDDTLFDDVFGDMEVDALVDKMITSVQEKKNVIYL